MKWGAWGLAEQENPFEQSTNLHHSPRNQVEGSSTVRNIQLGGAVREEHGPMRRT